MNKAAQHTPDDRIASQYADTLNALDQMQQSPYYAARKRVLSRAESAIVSLEQQRNDLIGVLRRAETLCKVALPQFNWGASALGADAIQLLNVVPGEIHAALAKVPK